MGLRHSVTLLEANFVTGWAPALSEMSAVVRLTISSRPSVSTAMWRLRPTIFLPAS